MKSNFNGISHAIFVFAVMVWAGVSTVAAQSTAFTYNGRLTGNGALASGAHDMQFTLYDANVAGNVVAGPLAISPVDVANGLFTVRIDFGPGKFTGPARWLDVAVRPTGGGAFTPLTPRQEVTSSPYSTRSQSAGTADSGGGGNDSVWAVTANNAHYMNGNVGVGTSAPQAKLHVQGDAIRFEKDGKILDLTAGSLTDITARNTSLVIQSLGTGGNNHLILNPFPNSGVFPNGNVGIGTFNPQSKLHVESFGAIESTVKSLTDRASLTLDSTIGGQQRVYTLDNGLFGTPGLFGIWDRTAAQARLAITPAGNVGIGTVVPVAQLQAETSAAKPAVYGNATADGTGLYGRSVSGVAVYADGNASQARDKGGFVKAMLHVAADGTIVRGYNSFLTGVAATTPPCGFSVTRQTSVNGVYLIDFGFQVNDRFFSITPRDDPQGPYNMGANFSFSGCTINQVKVQSFITGSQYSDPTGFMIVVY